MGYVLLLWGGSQIGKRPGSVLAKIWETKRGTLKAEILNPDGSARYQPRTIDRGDIAETFIDLPTPAQVRAAKKRLPVVEAYEATT